jgi:hypothetical protein
MSGRLSAAYHSCVANPLPVKLGIKPGARVFVVSAPHGFEQTLGTLPERVRMLRRARRPVDVVVFFTTRRAELVRRFPLLRDSLDRSGGLWVAWPKRKSGMATDLSFALVQETGLAAGLVDNKSCTIDDVWQALRFVYRLRDR